MDYRTDPQYQEYRADAFAQTTDPRSRQILTYCPSLVAHPGLLEARRPGRMYQDWECGGAICCSSEEAIILMNEIYRWGRMQVLEIGTYVGWSALHMATALPAGGLLTCVDTFAERKDGDVEAVLRANIGRSGLDAKINVVRGESPDVLPAVAPPGGWDMVFIDGEHNWGQPMRDVQGVLPLLAPGAVIFLHDAWMPDVSVAIAWLRGQGWKGDHLRTPMELARYVRSE